MLFDTARNVLASLGGVALVVALSALYLWWRYPNNLDLILAQVGRLFSFLGASARKMKVKREVQGRLNQQIKELDSQTEGLAPSGISVEWVQAGTKRESFLLRGQVVCRMSYTDHPHLNYLNAALLWAESGFIPSSRNYFDRDRRQAVDLAAIGLVLGKSGDQGVRNYFFSQVVPEQVKPGTPLSEQYEQLLHIERHGLFTHVFLPEAVGYGANTNMAPPRKHHRDEIERFVAFLTDLAKAADSRGMAQLDFTDANLAVSIIYVGIREKLTRAGYDPYLAMIDRCREQGARTIYMVATGRSRAELKAICETAAQQNKCVILSSRSFFRPIPERVERFPALVYRLGVA